MTSPSRSLHFSSEQQVNLLTTSLSDDLFDSSFSFMNNETTSMEYFVASPVTTSHTPDLPVTQGQAQERHIVSESSEHASDFAPRFPIPQSHSLHQNPSIPLSTVSDYPLSAAPYYPYPGMTYGSGNPSPAEGSGPILHPALYHPYRSSSGVFHGRNPTSPTSPSLASSPKESSGSQRPSSGTTTAVSPLMISPHSFVSTSLSDASPIQQYPYQLAQYAGTPLTSMAALGTVSPIRARHSVVSGFPYPVPINGQYMLPKGRGAIKSRPTRNASRRLAKQEDDEEPSDEEEVGAPSRDALGLIKEQGSKKKRPLGGKIDEQTRKGRVESEQRRRDELREAFEKLRDTLPPSNQKPSKANLLDRAVQWIQQIEGSNRWLAAERDKYCRQCEQLQQILHSNAVSRTASNSPEHGGKQ
nr:uncharacterized protein CI109_000070 [Kwoniella shandongensis]KAA5531232.1 hypothetical protein CI109_000070 [Kwoniella shandongensis]